LPEQVSLMIYKGA